MTPHLQLLPKAILSLTKPVDWNQVGDADRALEMAYGLFHRHIDQSNSKLRNIFAVSADQDRLHFAEEYAHSVLGLTDLSEFIWFRRGVWLRETLPTTRYLEQRDHSVRTLHNYLLGWYFFVNCAAVRRQFQESFSIRGFGTQLGQLINGFGELWCFASLLHDIGYLFEGEIPRDTAALLDEGTRDGVRWAYEYFQEIFWDTLKIRSVDERKAMRKIVGFDPESVPDGGAGTVIQFLRDIGSLKKLTEAINTENGASVNILETLPSDAFQVWAINYRAFGQDSMAQRIEVLEVALYELIQQGIPGQAIRVLDHGICGGLLLLKCSTYWFRLIFALKYSDPPEGSIEEKLKSRLMALFNAGPPYYAVHWWKSVVWATAAVAIHNVQQNDQSPGLPSKKKLRLSDDPLGHLE